jgi:mono/diheme cytochrome c family protein
MGGWAVTTVDHLPDYVEAGQPFTLSYIVRQHGEEPLTSLKGELEAVSGRTRVTAKAVDTRGGRYSVTMGLPHAGEWNLVIKPGFGPHKVKLLPIRAVAAGTPAPPLADYVRGERLFVAKGCVTCHVDMDVGPKLEGRRFEARYLAEFLASPKPTANLKPNQSPMPNLGLKSAEIAALVTYLNSERQLGVR